MYSIDQIKNELPELDYHPAATRLPMMQDYRFEGLKFDILDNEMRNPIWIVNGQLLDGRSRYAVLRWLKAEGRLSFEPDIREWHKPDDNFNSIVRSMNLHRNDYDKHQLAVYAARYLMPSMKEEALLRMHKKVPQELFPQVKKGTANSLAALLVGSNEKYVQYACKIQEKNDSFLDFVMEKQMTLQEGIEFINMKTEKREFFFEQMKAGMKFKSAKAEYEKTTRTEPKPYSGCEEEQETAQPEDHPDTDESIDILPDLSFDNKPSISESSESHPDHNNIQIASKQLEDQQTKNTLPSRIRKIKLETTVLRQDTVEVGIVFPKAIHQNALEEIVEVLHRHGYSTDHSYKILVASNMIQAKEFQEKIEPLLLDSSIIAYEVEPQDSVATID